MTPHNRNRQHLKFPLRTDHVLERIRIITRELENIQSEIYGRVSEVSQPDKPGLGDDSASVRVLDQFRATLDQVRNLLWFVPKRRKPVANSVTAIWRRQPLCCGPWRRPAPQFLRRRRHPGLLYASHQVQSHSSNGWTA